jgi:hypothetical protein
VSEAPVVLLAWWLWDRRGVLKGVLALTLPFALVTFLFQGNGHGFLLATDSALIYGAIVFGLGFLFGLPYALVLTADTRTAGQFSPRLISATLAALLSASYFYVSLGRGLPEVVALIAADPVANEFQVASVTRRHSFKGPRNCIEFRTFTLGSVCRVPDDAFDRIAVGQRLRLSGYGTQWGFFVEKIDPIAP